MSNWLQLINGMPAWAIGGFNPGNANAASLSNIQNVAYVLSVKTIEKAGRFTIGAYTGDNTVLINAAGGKDNSGFLAPWDRTISEVSD